jgi:anthranilate phosphoribosyltransferase
MSFEFNKLMEGHLLSSDEARDLMLEVLASRLSGSKVAAMLAALRLRDICAAELIGFRDALISQAVVPAIAGDDLMDVCGTGGDGKNTFNISTLSAFVLAACDIKIAKHGNYSASSVCGSSNLLEAIGVKLNPGTDYLKKCLEYNICFLHAPQFHPALKNLAPIRKELGFRTIFNILGPICNPLNPSFQYSGVSSVAIQNLYAEILVKLGKKYAVPYSFDGYDEISLTGKARVLSSSGDFQFSPGDFGLNTLAPSELSGGDNIDSSKEIFIRIISGKGSAAQNSVVSANAAFGIRLVNSQMKFEEAFVKAEEALLSGKAYKILRKITEIDV